jgi:hypothetical protein
MPVLALANGARVGRRLDAVAMNQRKKRATGTPGGVRSEDVRRYLSLRPLSATSVQAE